eukprot:12332238-Alexandrium_andersonii.AAC.1
MIREVVHAIPEIEVSDPNPLARVQQVVRIKPLATLGWAEASTEQKLARLLHSLILDAGVSHVR